MAGPNTELDIILEEIRNAYAARDIVGWNNGVEHLQTFINFALEVNNNVQWKLPLDYEYDFHGAEEAVNALLDDVPDNLDDPFDQILPPGGQIQPVQHVNVIPAQPLQLGIVPEGQQPGIVPDPLLGLPAQPLRLGIVPEGHQPGIVPDPLLGLPAQPLQLGIPAQPLQHGILPDPLLGVPAQPLQYGIVPEGHQPEIVPDPLLGVPAQPLQHGIVPDPPLPPIPGQAQIGTVHVPLLLDPYQHARQGVKRARDEPERTHHLRSNIMQQVYNCISSVDLILSNSFDPCNFHIMVLCPHVTAGVIWYTSLTFNCILHQVKCIDC